MIIAAVISEKFALIAENCVHGSKCLLTSCSKHNGTPASRAWIWLAPWNNSLTEGGGCRRVQSCWLTPLPYAQSETYSKQDLMHMARQLDPTSASRKCCVQCQPQPLPFPVAKEKHCHPAWHAEVKLYMLVRMDRSASSRLYVTRSMSASRATPVAMAASTTAPATSGSSLSSKGLGII